LLFVLGTLSHKDKIYIHISKDIKILYKVIYNAGKEIK